MRQTLIAIAIGGALATAHFPAAAQSRDSEIEALKAQIAALTAKVEALEARANAQSPAAVEQQPAPPAQSPTTPVAKADSKGGIKVSSADGKYEASVGAKMHFDVYAFDRDIVDTTGTTDIRRLELVLAGKAGGWDYKIEQDFAANSGFEGLRETYLATKMWGGRVTIGHFKPYRTMSELSSSNETLMLERPFASSNGLFNGRQYQQGLGYQRSGDHYTFGVSAFNLRNAAGPRNEGVGAAARATFAPINDETRTLHFGGWASIEDLNKGSADISAVANYAGRRGPSQTIATVTGASGDSVVAYGIEAAGAFGPGYFQSEYVRATFERPLGDQALTTWYVQGSWMLNGGHKPYKSATAVFGSPKVGDTGLWELTARYDTVKNEDIADREARNWLFGVNYYLSSNMRFMFNYIKGENEVNGDETAQYALRTQIGF